MAEEFEESQVVFRDNELGSDEECINLIKSRNSKLLKRRKKIRSSSPSISLSLPMNIPVHNNINPSWNIQSRVVVDSAASCYFDDDDDYDGQIVPPHVITGRRIAGNNKVMAFSLCTGNGRTLKGRDLSEVRNSILRLTGFLET